MTAHVKDPVAETSETTLAELRKSVTEIANDLSKVAERRARDVSNAAQAGTSELRRSIRRQPVLAMGIAAAAGAVLAIAVVPRSLGRRSTSRWDAWMPQMPQMPHVTRADLYDVADSLQRSVARATSGVPLASSFERLVDAVTKSAPNASINSIVDKAGAWLQRKREDAGK